MALLRKHNAAVAKQSEDAASSVAANILEGNRRAGRDRAHLLRVAAGSADETRGHVLVAEAWGWLVRKDIEEPLDHSDHVLAILWKLTH